MAITKSKQMVGAVGDMVYRNRYGRQELISKAARVRQPRTPSQMSQRSKWPNLLAMYRAFQPFAKHCFEEKAPGVSDYNRFLGVNMTSYSVYITRQMSSLRQGVAAPYIVSAGTLESIRVTGQGREAVTDIALSGFTLDEATTVGGFARAVVEQNPAFQYYDQLMFLLFRQTTDSFDNSPYIRAEGWQVMLDPMDSTPLYSVVSPLGFHLGGEGFLAVSPDVPQGTYGWVHFRQTSGGKVLVSTQRLIDNNPLLAQYTDEEALRASMQSYGMKKPSFLTPTPLG